MTATLHRLTRLVLASTLALTAAQAVADVWTKPTAEELQMTAEPAAPGAPAIFLYREERVDDKLHIHTTYARLKILTEKGQDYAIQEISYQATQFKIIRVEGRTIHSDGTVIPFTGKPFEKVLENAGKTKYKAIVFALPEVEVGSILEYRYELTYSDNLVVSPNWFLQGELFVRKAHYQFIPYERRVKNEHGDVTIDRINYSSYLPPGVSIVWLPGGNYYTLDADKIPAYRREEYMPPLDNISYRVLFYYTNATTAEEYWSYEGRYWSKSVERFIDAGKLTSAVNQIVSQPDTSSMKLQKLYGAVMKLENTSVSPEGKETEDRNQSAKVQTASEVWAEKRGSRNELAMLFVALARAAGFKAYVGVVTSRDRNIFVANFFSMGQLNDDIAIVEADGKEQFFDPGERYAEFGALHWKHTATQGIRQTEKGTALFATPTPGYKSTNVARTAVLEIHPDGKVSGSVRVILTGNQALYWREFALRNDEETLKQRFQESIQQIMPSGIEVKTDHFAGLNQWDQGLLSVLTVTGSMGMATTKFVYLPANFFAYNTGPLFALDKRTLPIDLQYPYALQDTVSIKLPPQYEIQNVPKDTEFTLPQSAFYKAKFSRQTGTVVSVRLFVLGNIFYKPEEYPELKDFYQKVNLKDKEPVVVQLTEATVPPAPASNSQ